MGMNCAKDPFNMGLFFTQGVLHYGYIFRPPTHTSGHFILKSPPRGVGLPERNIFLGLYISNNGGGTTFFILIASRENVFSNQKKKTCE